MSAQRLIRPSDIAGLAGVSPSAVANWRERQRDTFPKLAGGTMARPLYDYDEVVKWLHANGKNVRETTTSDLLWSAMASLRGVLEPEQFGRLVLTLLVVRKLTFANEAVAGLWANVRKGPSSAGDVVTELLDRVSVVAPEARELLDLDWTRSGLRTEHVRHVTDVIDSMAARDLATAASAVVARVVRSQARRGGASGAIDSVSAQVLATLAVRSNLVDEKVHAGLHAAMPKVLRLLSPVPEINSAYDPACGISETHFTLHSVRPNARLVGREIDQGVLMVARQRAFLENIDVDLARADTLQADPWPEGRADAVVAEPPFGIKLADKLPDWDKRWQFGTPNGSASDFAWLQDAIAHTAPQGRAYVLQPGGPLFRGGLAGSIRRGLVRAGCVEAVIALPPNIVTYTSIPLFVWVLRPISAPTESVTFIGVTRTGEIRSTDVAIADLLGEQNVNLTPDFWLADIALDDVDFAVEARAAERHLIESLGSLFSVGTVEIPAIDFAGTRVLKVGDLLKIRRGSVIPGEKGVVPPGTIRPSHVREGLPKNGHGGDVAAASRLTRPGDVLVTTQHSLQAIVDPDGGHAVSNQVSILTINEDVARPAYVAAALVGSWNQKFQRGSVTKSANVKDLEIPVPSLDIQDHIVAALDLAESARRAAEEAAAAATELTGSLLNAVRYGADLSGASMQ